MSTDEIRAHEQASAQVANEVLDELGGRLATRGYCLRLDPIYRSGSHTAYRSELRIYVLRDGQIENAIECFLVFDARPACTPKQLRDWLVATLEHELLGSADS